MTLISTGTSTPLPPYQALLAVDVEQYSGQPSAHQPGLGGLVTESLAQAFSRSGLNEVWHDRTFHQPTGDGYLLGVRPHWLPFLVHPLLDTLQTVLSEKQPDLRAARRDLRLRLRLALHIGPVPHTAADRPADRDQDDRHHTGRAASTTNELFRLLDAETVRAALDSSDPEVTLLACVVSQRVYEDAVVGGFSALIPSQFRSVTAQVKNFTQPAWLYVPKVSERAAPPAPQPQERPTPEPGPAGGPDRAAAVIHGDFHHGAIAGHVQGNMTTTFGEAPARAEGTR